MLTRSPTASKRVQTRSTGLFGPLDPLTDIDDDFGCCDDACSCRQCRLLRRRFQQAVYTANSETGGSSSPDSDPETEVWPVPLRQGIITGKRKLRRRLDRLERIHTQGNAHRIYQSRHWELEDARRCSTGYRGRSDLVLKERSSLPIGTPREAWIRTLEDSDYSFEAVSDVPLLLLDRVGSLIGVAVPPCMDTERIQEMGLEMEALMPFGKRCLESKRGKFLTVQHGVQFGGGSKVAGPRNSGKSPEERAVRMATNEFFTRPCVLELCERAADVFLKYFPEHYDYYDSCLQDICDITPNCNRPAGDLPFASFTLNVGSQSICHVHVDGCNLAGGLCLVSPYGCFDHMKGGQLILHELNLVLSLPPGSIILFPSALISHENIPIGAGEERRAFTAFSPSYMFQWVEAGYRKAPILPKEERWERGYQEWQREKKRFPHYSKYYGL